MCIQMFDLNGQLKTMFNENGIGGWFESQTNKVLGGGGGGQAHGPKNLATLHRCQYWASLFQPAI